MPHTSVPGPAFHQATDPPQSFPLLTYHTELLYPTTSFVLISLQEEIAFSTLRGSILPPSRIFTSTSFCATTPISSHPSTPKVTKAVSFSAKHVLQLATSEITEDMHIKHTKYTDLARCYLDMEVVVNSEADNEGTEEEEDGSFINDWASEDDQASSLSDPQQDEAA
ncbi:uncharacterized protein BJ212DRAFT_1477015 [Suillus subaureus]|uniref:Uncharacterized protein n=1 Tax=Suillus subaureus TaxID=48587 RepID=A0A9P7JGY2_9AGAM|nr:uncharacterized protein BJ212DRAFT_1477015 [Suillus subaureus]KAG1822595.1 hypothetical protein BJ212DRAFT_1477015 [Suillus subaureus]